MPKLMGYGHLIGMTFVPLLIHTKPYPVPIPVQFLDDNAHVSTMLSFTNSGPQAMCTRGSSDIHVCN